MILPAAGCMAPWPTGVINHRGEPVELAALAGRNVVLYFYGHDSAPARAVEGEGFYDRLPRLDAAIFGVSREGLKGHLAFVQKYGLPFALIPDPNRELADSYGLARYSGVASWRCCFLIGGDGRIRQVWPAADPERLWRDLLRILSGHALSR